MKIKKDKYLRARGGDAKLIDVGCSTCGKVFFTYQKDMPRGWLKRCYLNRIISPPLYSNLQHTVLNLKDLDLLRCKCGEVVGLPMIHKDGRFAFKMLKGKFTRSNHK